MNDRPMLSRCVCRAPHEIRELAPAEQYPLVSGHTVFALWRCCTCAGIAALPEENLTIALARGTLATQARIRARARSP